MWIAFRLRLYILIIKWSLLRGWFDSDCGVDNLWILLWIPFNNIYKLFLFLQFFFVDRSLFQLNILFVIIALSWTFFHQDFFQACINFTWFLIILFSNYFREFIWFFFQFYLFLSVLGQFWIFIFSLTR